MTIETQMNIFERSVIELAHAVRDEMHMAIDAYQKNDRQIAHDVIDFDDRINAMDQNINRIAIEILSLMQPVARDLRMIVGGIKISTDLERIGDYAKNIARFIIKRDAENLIMREQIAELAQIFLDNFDEVIGVLETHNVKRAYEVAALDENLDESFKKVIREFSQKVDGIDQFPVETTGILRNIERAGDHSKNICEQIIYIVNGNYIDFG